MIENQNNQIEASIIVLGCAFGALMIGLIIWMF